MAEPLNPTTPFITDDTLAGRMLADLHGGSAPNLARRAWLITSRLLFWGATFAGGLAILWGGLMLVLGELAAYAPGVGS